jgi:hypothetical protein
MAENSTRSLDTGTKVVIGLASLALLFAILGSEPGNDAWDADEPAGDVEAIGPTGTTWGSSSDGFSTVPGAPDDPWSAGGASSGDGRTDTSADDPWTRGGASFDTGDDDSDVPVDDPWTRGAPSSGGDGSPPSVPADDPWTRGQTPSGGGTSVSVPADDPWTRASAPSGDDGPPPCVGTMEFPTEGGTVRLPTDRPEDAFASPDCVIARGQSGGAVLLVQNALNACNGKSVALTGTNDRATAKALSEVQARQGLTTDGVYGPSTRRVMAWPTQSGGGTSRCLTHQDID